MGDNGRIGHSLSGLPLSEPIHQGSVYAFDDSLHADRAFAAGLPLYSRDGLPNVRSLERAVATLEEAEDALAVASGMAAISMTLLTFLSAGDRAIIGTEGYCDTSALFGELRRFGIEIEHVDLASPDALRHALVPKTKVVFAETISNPGMQLADLSGIAAMAHERGALLVVDNTFATPVCCRPISFGADIVVQSAGKFLAGHSDVTAGMICGSAALIEQIRQLAYLYGPLLAPIEAWLTLRGLQTLSVRMHQSNRSASEIADWLAGHPQIREVRYPGRDPRASVALLGGGGSVLTFQLRDGTRAASSVIEGLNRIPYVPSVGGTTTIVSFPPQTPGLDTSGKRIHEPYCSDTIRLSVGLEPADDIIAELDRALCGLEDTKAPNLHQRNGATETR